jgi:hypothetical protein
MEFAGKKDFPEANDILGAGQNENTIDLAIFRYQEGIYAKFLLTNEEVEELIKTRCLYLFVKAQTTYPIRIDVKSPFMTAEQMAQKEDEEIELINIMLRERYCLKRVNRDVTLEEAEAISNDIREEIFNGFPYLMRLVIRNTREKMAAEESLMKQAGDALKE